MLIFIASDYKGMISPREFTYCQAVIIQMKGLDKNVVCFQLLASASRTLSVLGLNPQATELSPLHMLVAVEVPLTAGKGARFFWSEANKYSNVILIYMFIYRKYSSQMLELNLPNRFITHLE